MACEILWVRRWKQSDAVKRAKDNSGKMLIEVKYEMRKIRWRRIRNQALINVYCEWLPMERSLRNCWVAFSCSAGSSDITFMRCSFKDIVGYYIVFWEVGISMRMLFYFFWSRSVQRKAVSKFPRICVRFIYEVDGARWGKRLKVDG